MGTPGWRQQVRTIATAQLPSWNRSVLDRWVKRAFEKADSTRHVVAHSGVLPHLPQLDGTDSHLWFGWRHGEADDLAEFARRLPRMVRFVSEFGSDSAPCSAPFIDEELRVNEWPHLDWDRLATEYGYERATFERLFPPSDFDSYEEWRDTTQHYQSHVLKVQIEALRRLKYRPTGGFCFSSLNDSGPAISAGILDADRVPKFACDAVHAACAPVIVTADPLPDLLEPGDRIDLDVHLISDLRIGSRLRGGRRRRLMARRRAALAIRRGCRCRRRGQGGPSPLRGARRRRHADHRSHVDGRRRRVDQPLRRATSTCTSNGRGVDRVS